MRYAANEQAWPHQRCHTGTILITSSTAALMLVIVMSDDSVKVIQKS